MRLIIPRIRQIGQNICGQKGFENTMKRLFPIILATAMLMCSCAGPTANTKNVSTASLSNVMVAFGLKKNQNAPPEVGTKIETLFEKYKAYYIGDQSQKELYLTFDEGYENGYTKQILDVLKANDVRACFFITGPYLKTETALVKRMVLEGHDVGNHTVNHPSMPSVGDDAELEKELTVLDMEFKELTGTNMHFLRPPKGEFSERTLAIGNNLGYTSVFWSFAYMDWDIHAQKGADYAYDSIMKYMHPGAVILLHAVSKDNADCLDRVIKDLKSQGYVFKSLKQLPG